MSLSIIYSRAITGVNAPPVIVEVHVSHGFPGLSIVGLPEKAVKESKDRVRSAIINSGFEFPAKRLTINLAPADLPKESGRFDLAIALGILAASEQIPTATLQDYEFAAELALDGVLRPIKGALPFAIATASAHRTLVIAMESAAEAALYEHIKVLPASHLLEVCAHLQQSKLLDPQVPTGLEFSSNKYPDLQDVKGQPRGKRALEITAAGGHSLLFRGPPGTGKTMLATRLPGILPPMRAEEALEVAALYSVSDHGFKPSNWRARPFRAPHHTASSVALVGGGRPPKPGEISLAHHGVLFLDELPEFNRHVLESLREPLEAGTVTISRASHQAQFPARFQLVAAMNPCPCGYLGDVNGRCSCTSEQVQRYQLRLSGPLLDRIDMQVTMPVPPKNILFAQNDQDAETSEIVRERVLKARAIQFDRQNKVNAALIGEEILEHCAIQLKEQNYLLEAVEKLGFSARAYHRILRLARTIADLQNETSIQIEYLQEALSYRM